MWLATEDDPDIADARSFWGVNITVLQNDFAAIPAKPPAAFDVRLYNAAKAHSDYLISIDDQTHTGQFDRIDAAGFKYTSAAGIVYSYSEHTVYGHAGFNIDWGPGTDGTQDPPGHRNAIMSVNADYTNVGYAVVAEATRSPHVGPQVITGNLCYANTGSAEPLQPLSGRHRLGRQQRQRPVRPRRGHRRGAGWSRTRATSLQSPRTAAAMPSPSRRPVTTRSLFPAPTITIPVTRTVTRGVRPVCSWT